MQKSFRIYPRPELQVSDEEVKKVSEILSNSMFLTMASACKTKAKKNEILMQEFLYFLRQKQLLRRYFGGSAAEGTELSTSDTDKMIVGPYIHVCFNPTDGENVTGHTFLVDTRDSSQGYGKLVLLTSDSSILTIFDQNGCPMKDMIEKNEEGEKLLPSEKVVEFWRKFLEKRQTATGPPKTHQHGPCATAVTKDPSGYIKKEVGGVLEQDFAHGLPFCRMPFEGEEWLRERENFIWPSMNTLERIKMLDCHVVAVGDKTSQHSSIEWRISYLLWERELVWSFNDVQLHCFVLLKSLLKKFIHPIVPEELSSYHMKTVVFWEFENTTESFWRRENLITLLKNCLLRLQKSVKYLDLKHFIDRSRNLFLGRMGDPGIKDELIEIIEDIIQNILVKSMQCIDDIDLATTWQNSHGNVEEFLQKCRNDHKRNITTDVEESRHSVELYYNGQASWLINVDNVLANPGMLNKYQKAFEDKTRTKDFDEDFLQSVAMYVNMRSALIQVKEMLQLKNDAVTDEHFKKLVITMNENSDIDAISGKLYVVTALLVFDKRDEASSRIKGIFSSSESCTKYVYTGLCSTCKTIEVARQTMVQVKGFPKTENLLVAHDMIFAKEDISLLPAALKFECLVDRAFLVHPAVYALYLRVLCSKLDEKMKNIDHLKRAVIECEGTNHNYRHFNILGYCYYEVRYFDLAYECYSASISQTAQDGRPNAAILMLLTLLFTVRENIM